MSSERKVEELYPRAPRYTVELGDNQIVRFAHMPRGSKTMHTRIVNISESGMAFLTPFLSAPEEGEKIKVEFTPPNSDSIASFAEVVRVQVHRTYRNGRSPQTFKLVAVEFDLLYSQQRQMLSQGLTNQLLLKQKKFQRQQFFLKLQWFLLSWITIPIQFLSRLNPLHLFKWKKKKTKDQSQNNNYIDV